MNKRIWIVDKNGVATKAKAEKKIRADTKGLKHKYSLLGNRPVFSGIVGMLENFDGTGANLPFDENKFNRHLKTLKHD